MRIRESGKMMPIRPDPDPQHYHNSSESIPGLHKRVQIWAKIMPHILIYISDFGILAANPPIQSQLTQPSWLPAAPLSLSFFSLWGSLGLCKYKLTGKRGMVYSMKVSILIL
jgi:hypothetical protein